MDEPIGGNSQGATGNVNIPDWMLRRRARQSRTGDQVTVAESIGSLGFEQEISPLRTTGAESEVTVVKDVITSSRAAPVWFKSKPAVARQDTSAETAAAAEIADTGGGLLPIAAEFAVPLDSQEAMGERWLGKAALRSYAISMVMHLLIALPLSIIVFHSELTDLGVDTLLAVQGDALTAESLDETPVFQLDQSGGLTGETLDTMLTASAVSNAFGPSSLKVPEDIGGFSKGEGEGTGDQVGNGLNIGGYKMPEGGKVVSKGSFTAWTVPDDPAPGEDYKIVIQVNYKKRNQKIPPGDITGTVVGTDKFRLMISRHTSEIIADANQVVIYIPGAMARVRDTIRVYSAMLRENQRIEIVF